MDDLMVNSFPLQKQATHMAFRELGHDLTSLPTGIRSRFIGKRAIDVSKEIATYLGLNIHPEAIDQRRSEVFLRLVKEKLGPMPGLLQSLELFTGLEFKIALGSSGAQEYVDLVLEKFEIARYFDVVVSGDCVEAGKPHPETYLVASERLGLAPSECIVLEDSAVGIESAKRAGCRCIAIRNPYTPSQDLSRADIVLDSLQMITQSLLAA